jgi:integrase
MQSLLIRLVIRIPLRQRNLREMHWEPNSLAEGRNLYKKSGVWHIRFRGEELKIAQVRGEEHLVEFEFPADLVTLLEEWLYKWRPFLLEIQRPEDQGKERVTGGQQFVFLNWRGCPLSLDHVTHAFERATYKFTGVAVNPHMFRTIFATEYIRETNNYTDAAYMLGDCVKTVIERYAKLLDEDCAKRASAWISHKLQGETAETNGNGHPSCLPKLQYPRGR